MPIQRLEVEGKRPRSKGIVGRLSAAQSKRDVVRNIQPRDGFPEALRVVFLKPEYFAETEDGLYRQSRNAVDSLAADGPFQPLGLA